MPHQLQESEELTLLSGDKVRLRILDDGDMKDFYNWWNDPEFASEFASFAPMNWVEFEKFVREASFFIIEKNEGSNNESASKKIGWISYYLTRLDYPYLYEIGYRTKPSERRKGYATEAVKLIVHFMFSTKNIERIESVTDVENMPSQRVLEKNGFKREGVLRRRSFTKGQYRDEYIYGILREEWLANV